jgi:Na+(H+)/acetate symporter ActP
VLSRVTIAKIALALIGVAVFFVGVRTESDVLRWIGIAFAAVAWMLRFVEKGQRRAQQQ